MNMNNIIVRSI